MIKRLKKVLYVSALFSVMSMGCINASAAELDTETAVIIDEADTVEDDSSGVHNGKVKVNETNFPDANFRSYLSDRFDRDFDGYINVSDVTEIYCIGYEISSLKGVEYLTELTLLDCDDNKLTSLDVTKCTNLTYLACSGNELTSLDVTKCTNLESLYCGDNKLTNLDVTKCTKLEELNCYGNELTSLDVTKCTNLTFLVCFNNELTSLDVTKCTKLEEFWCYNTKMTSLDVTKCTNLEILKCSSNELTSLDVSKCRSLKYLECYGNEFTCLDVSKCTSLENLNCSNNELTSLDVTNCTKLESLDCYNNYLSSLDVTDCVNLKSIICFNNELTSLDVTKCTKLEYFDCYDNYLTSLDVTNCTNINELYCYDNQLASLTVSEGTKISRLVCHYNRLFDLDLTKFSSLNDLSVDYGLFINLNNIDKMKSLQNIHIHTVSYWEEGYNLKKLGTITNSITDENYNKDNCILKIRSDELVKDTDYTINLHSILFFYNIYTVDMNGGPQIYIRTSGYASPSVAYKTHIQSYGDSQGTKKNGEMAGTSGEAKRLENISIYIDSFHRFGIQYTTHCQSYGWMPWSSIGETNGTAGEAKRLEAIKIQLTGDDKDDYDVYYRVHAQSYGWLGWAKNGEPSGTAGYGKRLEGIQIVVLEKGSPAPGATYKGVTGSATNKAYYAKDNTVPSVSGSDNVNVKYRTHVQTYGWQGFKYNGAMSGTSGKAKRLEGIEIDLTNQKYDGDIVYTTHIQTYGWQGKLEDQSTWIKNGAMSGTSGEAKRLEAICINLTGEMAEHYDIYYRVHAQSYGWLGWAKNGECSGTAGYGKRLEGIQIVLVEKGGAAPANNYGGITANDERAYIEK